MARLPNYLRSNRRHMALSQGEVGFLLGKHGGAKVCRYERFTCQPELETVLAFEAIFQKPASEIFAGLYQQVQRDVMARAKVLAHKIECGKPNRKTTVRRQAISSFTSKSPN